MARRLTVEEKFYRMMKKNETADTIYTTFIKSKSEGEKLKGLEMLKEAASIENKEIDIRSKAIALLRYFIFMAEGESEFYWDLKFTRKIIKNDIEIPEIIEENIEELNSYFENKSIDLLRMDPEMYNLIVEVMLAIEEFNLKTKKSKIFYKLLKSSSSLKEKLNNKSLNEREFYIVGQLQRMKLM